MGKSNKKRRDTAVSIANQRLPFAINTNQSFGFSQFGDRRNYHPDGFYRPALRFSGAPARYSVGPASTRRSQSIKKKFSGLRPESGRSFLAFSDPGRVLICARRKIRREVMFARRKTGRVGQKRPRFNWYSSISCRR